MRAQYKIFKGTETEYVALHYWVRKNLGRPMICWNCGDTSKSRYEWANKSGEYKKDLDDWLRLCKPCHMRHDKSPLLASGPDNHSWNGETCSKGHRLEGDNLYIKLMKRPSEPEGSRYGMSKLHCIVTDCPNEACYIYKGFSLCHIHFDKETSKL